ncbi:MAG: hypothetical protein H8K10_05820 [Nitrospira sp.]|nr:hypothetical protein [Nitrospira sp.]
MQKLTNMHRTRRANDIHGPTDMTTGYEMKKINPRQVAEAGLIGIEAGKEEVLVDDFAREVKQSVFTDRPLYLNPPEIG